MATNPRAQLTSLSPSPTATAQPSGRAGELTPHPAQRKGRARAADAESNRKNIRTLKAPCEPSEAAELI